MKQTHPCSHRPAGSPAPTKAAGFTVIELLAVIVIIGLLVTGVSVAWQRVTLALKEDVVSTAVLTDMKKLKNALVSGFHADTGLLPCAEKTATAGGGEYRATEYAGRYLGFSMDCEPETIEKAQFRFDNGDFIECEKLSGHCREMCRFLSPETHWSEIGKEIKIPDTRKPALPLKEPFVWNKYYATGWRGDYLQMNAVFNATEFDPLRYPAGKDDAPIYLPAMETPYAKHCEALALEADENGDESLAREYRRGKYYHIMGTTTNAILIMSRGEDCLPAPAANVEDCIRRRGDTVDCPVKTAYVEKCLEQFEACKSHCLFPGKTTCQSAVCDRSDYEPSCITQYGGNGAPAKLCVEERFAACVQCAKKCLLPRQNPCFQRLQITNPDIPGYIDLEDDTVMFVFSGLIRSPLEK